MKATLPLIVGLLAGLSCGFIVGKMTSDSWLVEAPLATIPSQSQRERPPKQEQPPLESPTPDDAVADDDSPASYEAAVARVQDLNIGEGDGAIRGRVLTPAGEPIRGVQITATPSEDFFTRAGDERKDVREASLEEFIEQSAIDYVFQTRLGRATETHEDGSYTLDGLVADFKYRVAASLEGYTFERVDGPRHASVGPPSVGSSQGPFCR